MKREEMISRLDETFDVIVVGGGASGLGVAVDASSRGYRTLLVEAHDFAKATSSRSTKLVHGGVRYLEQLNFSLVTEALRERGRLYQNAPHMVGDLPFIVPRYKWWEGPFYGIGLKLYDALAGKLNLARSRQLGRDATIEAIPNVHLDGLEGGVMYHDGQFDDARMAIALARTAADHGAVVVNRMKVVGLLKDDGHVRGVELEDAETGERRSISARVVVNATGIFSDSVRRMDDDAAIPMIEPAQGVHLVLDHSFGPGDTAIMVPHTDDGRVLFVIPWHDRVIVGTTDTEMDHPELEPRALPEEIEFILRNAARYLQREPTHADILSVYAGQRPLVHKGGTGEKSKAISRSHEVVISEAGLVSIMGGKWTTFRQMAEDTMAQAMLVGELEDRPCVTEELHLHGYLEREDPAMPSGHVMRQYGSDAVAIDGLVAEDPSLAEMIHERLPYRGAEILWAARCEMACCVEDVLARRTRALLLDARASIEAAPRVASILASELGHDAAWEASEVAAYTELALGYLPAS
ncbi:MAG: FAD-dependent oxidoreductase [Planctomycetaceae bacterium]|nr:FAD-dependent oxidoreductase [Planctomycetaceae bacterium]|tara:strand:- start:207 stop:1775 length:1569 start_codon:yes stop_codon:yes gene_type:complete